MGSSQTPHKVGAVYPHVTGEEIGTRGSDQRAHSDTEREWRTQVSPSRPSLPFGTHKGLTTCIAAW